MTRGFDALAEAMRMEQARIYGQLQREHRERPAPETRRADVHDLAAEREKRRTA